MRRLSRIFFYVFIFSVTTVAFVSHAATTMQNDSESIDLPGAAGTDAISGDSDGGGDGGGTGTFNTGGGNNGGSGSGPGQSGQGNTGTDGTGGTDVVVVLGQNPGTTATSTTQTDQVVDLLTSSGAVTVNVSGSAGATGASGSTNSGTSIKISGSTLRAALRGAGINKLSVFGWDLDAVNAETEAYKSEASFTPRDVSLIASSAVLANQSIQSVELLGGTLIVSYLSKGWLLWCIPLTYSVTVTVDAAAPEGQRVTVAFPWYLFITWVEVSPRELAADLNAAIIGSNAAGITPEEAQARLFTQVTKVLKSVRDAVPDTIR